MIIGRNERVDLCRLAEKLQLWFLERDWDVMVYPGSDSCVIVARNADTLRRIFAACRTLIVKCYHENGATRIDIRQGSWGENIASNAFWLMTTGKTVLAVTCWSFAVQRQFKNYAQKVLDQV